MPAQSVSITDAARNLSDFVNRVAYRKESFYLIRGRRPVAELRPVPQGRSWKELEECAGSWPRLDPPALASLRNDLIRLRSRD